MLRGSQCNCQPGWLLLFMLMGWDCLWTAANSRLIAHPPGDIWVWRPKVEWYWQGKQRTLREACPIVTLSTTDSATRARIRASAVRDRLSYGTAFNQCGQSSGGRVRSFTQPASSSSSPWLSSLTYHPGVEKQARWWPRFWDVSPHRHDQSLKSCYNLSFVHRMSRCTHSYSGRPALRSVILTRYHHFSLRCSC
jgi:hypothetical protein